YHHRPQQTQREHHWNTRAKFAGHRLNVFDLDPLEDFLGRHSREFYAAKQVSPQPLKMPAYKAMQVARRLFAGERNRNVAFCQTPVFSRNQPRARAKELPNSKEKSQWQRGGNGRSSAIKNINDKVEHCGTGSIAGWRGRVDLPTACFNQYNVAGVVAVS